MVKVVFFGSSQVSLSVVEKLASLDFISIIACVTQPDKPIGRKQFLTPTPVAKFCIIKKIPLFKPVSNISNPLLLREPEVFSKKIKVLEPDLLLVCDYGQKIPAETIKTAKLGGINIHFSLLPKYKGAAPIEWAILNGDCETGITFLTLEDEIDNGKIIIQEKYKMTGNETSGDLYNLLTLKSVELLPEVLNNYIEGKIILKPQNNLNSNFAPRLKKDDARIDWSKKPLDIYRMIRAFTPRPGVFTFVQIKNATPIKSGQNLRMKILKAHMVGNLLILDKVQLEGKNPVTFKQFKEAYKNFEFV